MSLLTVDDIRSRCVIDPVSGCWHWQGAAARDGTPRFHTLDYARCEKRTMSGPVGMWHIAHQAAPLPGYLVMRSCCQKLCLNPVHLREVKNRREMGLHIKRNGKRKGTHVEARRANLAIARQVTGIAETPAEVVRAIRAADRTLTNKALAAQYGMNHQTVSRIRLGQTRAGV